ncbi:large conductance mechanosensitive channel protein MscL [Ruania suaedae]|uniref:large conductance mechanosensitive channel protein MscL n=1 Tax=Ruania suaedae TaxID=2897774 RepID=UPI001E35089E|nr:large conductance mechanosensitive channel protein MscL [Ruania suaedae]UFU04567.1 large conductance mechanosensitive channel protein MscL [Ruania suaedae]
MLQGFKEFIARGNVIDLAVGVVIGAAFGTVVTALVDNVLNPLIGGIFGQPNLDRIWVITMRTAEQTGGEPTEVLLGAVLTALINFLLVAAAIYFAVVMPMNKLAERRARGVEPAPAAPAEDILLLTEIRDLLATKN